MMVFRMITYSPRKLSHCSLRRVRVFGLPCLIVAYIVSLLIRHQWLQAIGTHDLVAHDESLVCQESPIGNLTKRDPSQYRHHGLSLKGPGADRDILDGRNNSTDTAVCAFRAGKHSRHFPHAMQQIYQCWSFWNLPVNRNKRKVFVEPSDVPNFPSGPISWREWFAGRRNRNYILEFLEVLQEAKSFQLTVIPEHHQLKNHAELLPVMRRDHANTFLLRSPDDAHSLRATFLQHYNIQVPDSGCPASSSNRTHSASPRITLLNRDPVNSYRSILNGPAIVDSLALHHLNVRQVSFEDATLRQQVSVLAETDLLLSSHGAQLTGLVFLPPRCARVLELFPPFYYFDVFFGSLADAAGVASYQQYLSDGNVVADRMYAEGLDSIRRHAFRNVNLCPPVTAMVNAVRVMVDDWRDCCDNQGHERTM